MPSHTALLHDSSLHHGPRRSHFHFCATHNTRNAFLCARASNSNVVPGRCLCSNRSPPKRSVARPHPHTPTHAPPHTTKPTGPKRNRADVIRTTGVSGGIIPCHPPGQELHPSQTPLHLTRTRRLTHLSDEPCGCVGVVVHDEGRVSDSLRNRRLGVCCGRRLPG